jgi:hypothetical protein
MSLLSKAFSRVERLIAARKEERRSGQIDAIREALGRGFYGRQLLDLLDKSGIPITFDDALVGSGDGGRFRQTKDHMCIVLNPECTTFAGISILAHELRHYWQKKKLDLSFDAGCAVRKDPLFNLVYTRVIEADAAAFARLTLSDIVERQGMFQPAEKAARPRKTINGLPAEAAAQKFFREELAPSPRYDRQAAREGYAQVISDPDGDAGEARHNLAYKDLRGLLKAGLDEDAPPYLPEMDDDRFRAFILRSTEPAARKTIRLMDRFAKAVEKGGRASPEAKELRAAIEKRMPLMDTQPERKWTM